MMNPQTAYFFKRFYGNIIKWWFVAYNTDAIKIWPSKKEAEAARLKEEEEKEKEKKAHDAPLPSDSYNASTGSYSGLYGQGEMTQETQLRLAEIMKKCSSQTAIDSYVKDVILPPEQDDIIKEANIIYERLLREAKEDEERKAAEIEAAKLAAAGCS